MRQKPTKRTEIGRPITCPRCGGLGTVLKVTTIGGHASRVQKKCRKCDGRGICMEGDK